MRELSMSDNGTCNGNNRLAAVLDSPLPNGGNGEAVRPDGRNGKGQFAKGCKGGPGNPYNRRTAELRIALREAVGEKGMARLSQALLKRVEEEGDLAAAQLLLDYTIGKPISKNPHPDRLDDDEYHVLASGPSMMELSNDGKGHLPAAFAVAAMRAMLRAMRCFYMRTGHDTGALPWPMAARAHSGLFDGTWDQVVAELDDPELKEWLESVRYEELPPACRPMSSPESEETK
jgi:hypothetical protein